MKKFKLYRKVAALALVGTMATSILVGCGSKDSTTSFLDGTTLEDTRVISFEDGHKDITNIEYIGCNNRKCDCDKKMYRSIVTDEYFANDECKASIYYNHSNNNQYILNHYNIINDESIISYLTTDEIVKASKNELTEDDITNIISRIFTKEETQKLK